MTIQETICEHAKTYLQNNKDRDAIMIINPNSFYEFVGSVVCPIPERVVVDKTSAGANNPKLMLYGLHLIVYRSQDMPEGEVVIAKSYSLLQPSEQNAHTIRHETFVATEAYYTAWTPVNGLVRWIEWDNRYRLTPHQEEAFKFSDTEGLDEALENLGLNRSRIHVFKHTTGYLPY